MADDDDAAATGGTLWVGSKEVTGEVRDWSDLTTVCLTNIFRRLPLEDLWRGAMFTCHSWLDASKDSSLFESLDLESAFAAAGSIRADAAAWWTPAFQRRVDAMLRSAAQWADGSLREVRIRHCSNEAICFAAERSPNLETLSVRSCQNITDRSIFKVASCCLMLRELDISNCYEVTYKALEMIGQNCPNLTNLKRNLMNWLDPSQHVGIVPEEYLRACPQDGDTEATVIARFMPKLNHLEVRFLKLSNKGLLSISEGCRDLELLDIFGCANLTTRGIEQASANLKNLKTLIRPNFFIPRSGIQIERYGHWRLYDERHNAFRVTSCRCVTSCRSVVCTGYYFLSLKSESMPNMFGTRKGCYAIRHNS